MFFLHCARETRTLSTYVNTGKSHTEVQPHTYADRQHGPAIGWANWQVQIQVSPATQGLDKRHTRHLPPRAPTTDPPHTPPPFCLRLPLTLSMPSFLFVYHHHRPSAPSHAIPPPDCPTPLVTLTHTFSICVSPNSTLHHAASSPDIFPLPRPCKRRRCLRTRRPRRRFSTAVFHFQFLKCQSDWHVHAHPTHAISYAAAAAAATATAAGASADAYYSTLIAKACE